MKMTVILDADGEIVGTVVGEYTSDFVADLEGGAETAIKLEEGQRLQVIDVSDDLMGVYFSDAKEVHERVRQSLR